MKTLFVAVVLVLMLGRLGAEEIHTVIANDPTPARKARAKRVVSRFWTPRTIVLVALDGGAKAADGYATRYNIDRGGVEHDPLMRPFVHTTGVHVSAMAAMFGGEVAAAFLLHRRRHDRLARLVLLGGTVVNGFGATTSFMHR